MWKRYTWNNKGNDDSIHLKIFSKRGMAPLHVELHDAVGRPGRVVCGRLRGRHEAAAQQEALASALLSKTF